jgi:ribosomal protein S18 acetylase RimI-like enzyme
VLPLVKPTTRMKGRIRPLTPQDYKSVKDIFEATFKIKMPNSTWRYRNRQRSLGIFSNAGDLLGFILMSGKSYISRIAVHPLFQSLGLGSKSVPTAKKRFRVFLLNTPICPSVQVLSRLTE